MICFPNAKINLGLNIVSKREDGYHNLETVFYPIPLEDSLEFVTLAQDQETVFSNYGIAVDGPGDNNLVMRAYRLLASMYDLPPVHVYLRKNIPFGAGLGGGSSDAAFMIKMLNDAFHLDLTLSQMEELAARLGADAPFFIQNKPVFATGIGNVFHPVELSLKGYYLVLIKPDVAVSTPEAYRLVKPKMPAYSLTEIIKRPVEEWKDLMVNDFEESVFDRQPVIGEIKAKLYEMGALYASMSGSGSSVFGIFKDSQCLADLQSQFGCFCFTDSFR